MKNLDFIYNRKSIRKFKDIEVKEDTIENLLDANNELSLANTYLEKQNISLDLLLSINTD